MNRVVWSFLAGFLLTVVAFAAVSVTVMNWLDEPVPGWLSDHSGRP